MIKLRPEILTHPNIPKPLHGISPRTIMGDTWWNKERQVVYASSNYHCIACGVHKSEAKGRKWLEAHEFWDIDYQTGVCTIKSIEPLCNYCHSFIHSGRLRVLTGSKITEQTAINILEHGFKILSENNLQCFYGTLDFAESLNCNTFNVEAYTISENKALTWQDYQLHWNDSVYKSKFKDISEWEEFYR